MKTYRLARVAEAVREVASETILFELRDPRVKQVTVTRAEVSGDLQHAKVYVSIMGTDKEQQLSLRGLRHAAGFIQSKLARRLQTRFTPVLHFVLDQGVKRSIEMTRLINEARAEAAPPPGPDDGGTGVSPVRGLQDRRDAGPATEEDRRDAGPPDDSPASASAEGTAEDDADTP